MGHHSIDCSLVSDALYFLSRAERHWGLPDETLRTKWQKLVQECFSTLAYGLKKRYASLAQKIDDDDKWLFLYALQTALDANDNKNTESFAHYTTSSGRVIALNVRDISLHLFRDHYDPVKLNSFCRNISKSYRGYGTQDCRMLDYSYQ